MLEELREKARRLPLRPGVYIMMDKTGKVIYVGKAKQLKNRVSSYFHGEHDAKTSMMVSKIDHFDVILANSEFEALVLENSLIKQHMPRYNIMLKDDKGYPFVRLDLSAEYPVFEIVSKMAEDGAQYYGPYAGRNVTKAALDAICKALKLPTCHRKFPRDIGRGRPCLNRHMGNCMGYCTGNPGAAEYRAAIGDAVMVLEGRTRQLKQQLEAQMNQAAERLQFERAAELRDRIRAIQKLETQQNIITGKVSDTDIVGFYRGEAKSCLVVLHYIEGKLSGKDYQVFETPLEEDDEAISSLLRQYYLNQGTAPREIFLPMDVGDSVLLEQLFSQELGRKVEIRTPVRGDKRRLVETANMNAREEVQRITSRQERAQRNLEWLQKALHLPDLPRRIEAYDISNTGDSDIVASMTVFVDGRPSKKDYRKFKIKTLQTRDDYGSMREVVGRRLERYLAGDEKFAPLPDLMLIDGGEKHAAAAAEVVAARGLHLPVFGMVKDDRHRTRAIVSPEGQEIGLTGNQAAFAFVGTIQEETHRFAITFHQATRSKHTRQSELDKIEGIGPKRRSDLLKHFKSIKSIKEAGLEELGTVLPKNVAEQVYRHFHPGNGE